MEESNFILTCRCFYLAEIILISFYFFKVVGRIVLYVNEKNEAEKIEKERISKAIKGMSAQGCEVNENKEVEKEEMSIQENEKSTQTRNVIILPEDTFYTLTASVLLICGLLVYVAYSWVLFELKLYYCYYRH